MTESSQPPWFERMGLERASERHPDAMREAAARARNAAAPLSGERTPVTEPAHRFVPPGRPR